MRYNHLADAARETIKKVIEDGVIKKAGIWQASDIYQDQEMIVLTNEFFSVPIPTSEIFLQNLTGADIPWAEDHFQERISGKPTNPGMTYKWWPYHNNLDKSEFKDEKFSHTYQERFWPKHANSEEKGYYIHSGIRYPWGDLGDVIRQLKENPLTRQAYLPIFFPEDTGAVHKQRVPCTLGYYFYIDGNNLHINYIIRSCDILRHFRNDLYLTGRLLQYVAGILGLQTGYMQFLCFNLHLFKNDLYALKKKENGKNK